MSEFYIGTSWQRAETAETVSVDRLSLAGCIGVWSNRLRNFPLPLLALDGQLEIVEFENVTRVRGLLPSETSGNYLIKGSWTGEVDIPGKSSHGEGTVYLGNGNSPSETWGYIFERMVPFNPALELGFVHDPADKQVLHEREYGDKIGFLIYAEPQIIEGLGRIHRY